MPDKRARVKLIRILTEFDFDPFEIAIDILKNYFKKLFTCLINVYFDIIFKIFNMHLTTCFDREGSLECVNPCSLLGNGKCSPDSWRTSSNFDIHR